MCLKIGAVDLLQMSTSAVCQGKIVYVSVNISTQSGGAIAGAQMELLTTPASKVAA
jgi:predicted outer membrane repeat protein